MIDFLPFESIEWLGKKVINHCERKKLRAMEAAAYLSVSRSTLAKWRMSNLGPLYHRCGPRIVYYYQDEIDAWLADCDRELAKQKHEQRS